MIQEKIKKIKTAVKNVKKTENIIYLKVCTANTET
jgi:hypothetical protein